MKHYLDLIPISAKKHKKQDRMTRLCIVLAVFLVSVIFGMADMEMRSQLIQAIKTDGSWHAVFRVEDEEQGALIGARPEVENVARYGALNYRLEDGWQIEDRETGICGFDSAFMEMVPEVQILEGTLPETGEEMAINENVAFRLGKKTGDSISLRTPTGEEKTYRITGITKNTALLAELDAFCVFLSLDEFDQLYAENIAGSQEMVYYVTFHRFCNISKTIQEITDQLGLEKGQVGQNVKVLTLMFQSRDPYMMNFYLVAVVLAILVMVAGIFMITASMNSNIARRTEFFGMLRCLGATRKQVIRFVRREALSWCRTAIPVGLLAGTVVVWGLCRMLRFLSPGMFEGLPLFGVSGIGIVSGIVIGFLTVLLAARSPAKRAAKVSPLTAVSGNAGTVQAAKKAASTRFFKVEAALGIHHAFGSKKNCFLVTGSFAFSIILFLAFSTAIDFMHHAINPLQPSAPDIYIYSEEVSNKIPSGLVEKIEEKPGVKHAFGRSCVDFSMMTEEGERIVMVISYDELQFEWAKESLVEGSLSEAIAGEGVLCAYWEGTTLTAGRNVTLLSEGKSQEVSVTGVLGKVPYDVGINASTGSGEELVICSEEMFRRLTGESDYAVLDVQLYSGTTDAEVQELRKMMEEACGEGMVFSDKRIGNQEAKGASYSMSVFLYGFLAVIALIGFFNIINCVAMSVSARLREYGAMRAIGMSMRQLFYMVLGEALTYIGLGAAVGCAVGFPINRLLFQSLVTKRWGTAWTLPGWELLVILAVMLGAVCLAVTGPAEQIRKMTVVDTISMR